jgi:hypothetical protein
VERIFSTERQASLVGGISHVVLFAGVQKFENSTKPASALELALPFS